MLICGTCMFSCVSEFLETKQLATNRYVARYFFTLDFGELYNKKLHCQELSRRRSSVARFVAMLHPVSQESGCNKMGAIRTAKRAMFTVQVDIFNSCWPTDVHN